ncbi:MAG: bifunctional (p)ppGpp synthetase/guanosine-3',5'-bis(diphosphate) 3'-pyrophosphohydrolase [Rhodanobacteraceae bacterium]|jgi:(p)ppGpp synthase/HD superfamily hydrolase|nr:MAG: bifunctional (p)ppGpp synthetase/guanosine-3',5'-bis(diphosphate) 3'-pyrophosphohydrolase [Rhodanobacteraceae bacterium]
MLSQRFTQAVDYAREAHASQTRKGTSIPYIAHLLGVASLVLDYGGDEDQAIAALLHDTIEDQGEHHEAVIRRQFGDRVAGIVLACTDGTLEGKDVPPEQKRADWEQRKRRYLAHLADEPGDALLVSGCDKLHNARAIVADLRAVGPAVFERFTGRRDGTLWYYREIADVFSRRGVPMAGELRNAVEAMAMEF